MTREIRPRANLDTFLTAKQTIQLPRVRGETQSRTVTFATWGKRVVLTASDQIELDISGLRADTRSRWLVREPLAADSKPWAAKDTLTDPDGTEWTVIGVQTARNAGGYVELLCSTNAARQIEE